MDFCSTTAAAMAPSTPSSLNALLQSWRQLLSLWKQTSTLSRAAGEASTMPSPAKSESPPELKPFNNRYEQSRSLQALLEQLELSVLLSTNQAMGLCSTASGIALGTRDAIWSLPASRKIAPHIKPGGAHVIALPARSCHQSGLLMNHDLAWGGEELRDSLSHRPRSEVLLESGPRNLRCWLEAGLWTVGVIRALGRIRSSLEKVPSWLPPSPATTG